MRQRSKSLHVENPTKLLTNQFDDDSSNDDIEDQTDNDNDSESEFEEPNIYNIKKEDWIWSTEDDLKLVCKVAEQISIKENCPYEKSVSGINWSSINLNGVKSNKLQSYFEKIVNSCRTWKTLPEILSEAHKKLLSDLPSVQKPQTTFALFVRDRKGQSLSDSQSPNYFENASAIYKSLNDEQKEEYRKEAVNIKKKYETEISQYKLNMKKKRSAKDDSPLVLFWNYNKLHGKMPYVDSRKLYAEMSNKEKLKWILRFLGVKRDDKLTIEQLQKAKKLSKDEIQIIQDYEGRPKKLNAYNLFMKDFLSKKRINNDLPWGQVFKLGVDKWKKLSNGKKSKYENLAKQNKVNYEVAYQQFLNSLPEQRKAYELSARKKNFNTSEKKSPKRQKKIKQEIIEDEGVLKTPSKVITTPKSKNKLNGTGSDAAISKPVHDTSTASTTKKNKKTAISGKNTDKPIKQNSTEEQQRILKMEVDTNQTSGTSSKKLKKDQKIKENSSILPMSPKIKKRSVEDSFFASENVNANSTKIQQTPKKKRKISLSDSQSDSKPSKINKELTENPNKKPKRENLSPNEQKNSSLNEIDKMNLTKPPNTVFKYFKKEIYKGPIANVKESYNALSIKEKNSLKLKYNKAKKAYLNNFENYLKSLSQNDLYTYAQVMQNKGQEQSDDSDSDSN